MIKTKRTIAITGASGFLGKALVHHFANNDWKVIALSREKKQYENPNIETRFYDLTKPLQKNLLNDVTYLVHAAYVKLDRDKDAMKHNIEGSKRLVKLANDSKVRHMLFISTMSAHDEAISVYGKQKLEIEKIFMKNNNSTVLKCGLIIGNGGIVKDMADFMRTKRIVPLIGGGMQPLQIISLDNLINIIDITFSKSIYGRFVAANPIVYSYRTFYKNLASYINVNILLINMPYWILEVVFKIAKILHLPLNVGGDNLKGLKMLKSMRSDKDMMQYGLALDSLSDALKKSSIR